jgi:hypothetical protein
MDHADENGWSRNDEREPLELRSHSQEALLTPTPLMSVSFEDLKKVQLFSELQQEVLERISKTLRHLTVNAGHVIVKQGSVANDMFFIISGTSFHPRSHLLEICLLFPFRLVEVFVLFSA